MNSVIFVISRQFSVLKNHQSIYIDKHKMQGKKSYLETASDKTEHQRKQGTNCSRIRKVEHNRQIEPNPADMNRTPNAWDCIFQERGIQRYQICTYK